MPARSRRIALLRLSTVVVVLGCRWGALGAAEICGLQNAVFDGIFVDGFNAATSGIGPAYASVNAPPVGATPTVTMTSPVSGATVGRQIQVTGTVSGPPNVGVIVNGKKAYVNGGLFLVPGFVLDPNSIQLTAVATAPDSLSATATRAISVSVVEPGAILVADAEVGFAPLPVRFSVRLRAGLSMQSLSLDFQSDGALDHTGGGAVPLTTYGTAGIYTATATITLTDNTVISASRKVIALDLSEQRSNVCSVYANLRASLVAQDATTAARSLTGPLRTKLLGLFNALGVKMPAVAAGLGTLADGLIGLDTADLVAVREIAGALRGYPIHMVRDSSGVWRIDAM